MVLRDYCSRGCLSKLQSPSVSRLNAISSIDSIKPRAVSNTIRSTDSTAPPVHSSQSSDMLKLQHKAKRSSCQQQPSWVCVIHHHPQASPPPQQHVSPGPCLCSAYPATTNNRHRLLNICSMLYRCASLQSPCTPCSLLDTTHLA